jgi:hypothetical protein
LFALFEALFEQLSDYSQQRKRGKCEGEKLLFLEKIGKLGRGSNTKSGYLPFGSSVVRWMFPSLALAMLVFSMGVALFADVRSPEQRTTNDHEDSAVIMATGTPPKFNQTLPPIVYVTKGLMATINVTVYDADNDSIHVEWLWGDGSPNSTNDTDPAFTAQLVSQTHTWNPYSEQGTGGYYIASGRLNITITDGNGNFVTVSRPVQVLVPDNLSPNIGIIGPSGTMDPFDNVTIFANASDPEGEPLTWTFVFNDSQTDFLTIVNHTDWTAPNQLVWNNVSYIFGIEGLYTVTMYVSDALPPNQTGFHNLSQPVTIRVAWNLAPSTSAEIAADPIEPIITSALGYVLVNYSVEAYDLDGDILTATWDFGDGTGATNVSEGTTVKYEFVQVVNYTETGVHNITVMISDGRSNHTMMVYRNLTVSSTNLPPNVVALHFQYPTGSFALPNETLNWTFTFTDPENDPLQVVVDFGDGTIEYYNVTQYDEHGNATLRFTHAFSETGSKKIIVSYTDNKTGKYEHFLYQNLTVEVGLLPEVIPHDWSWWDYTSLGLVAMIPVLVALRLIAVGARRKRLENQGMSVEEWKLMKSEMQVQDAKKR